MFCYIGMEAGKPNDIGGSSDTGGPSDVGVRAKSVGGPVNQVVR